MGRHSQSYRQRQQALHHRSAPSPATVVHVGRIGLLAVALGIGFAAYSGTAVAEAEVTSSNAGGAAAAEGSPQPDSHATATTEQDTEGRETDAEGEDEDRGDFAGGDGDLDDAVNDDIEDADLELDERDAAQSVDTQSVDTDQAGTDQVEVETVAAVPDPPAGSGDYSPASLTRAPLTSGRSSTVDTVTTAALPDPDDQAATEYGDIGKWMLERNGDIADYGGLPYDGKTVLEPVNVIFVDQTSRSALEATWRLSAAMRRAGFPPRFFHSTGFRGLIDDVRYRQRPGGLLLGYSDDFFLLPNNHGRIFGPDPVETSSGYVWSGAFSTEEFTFYQGLPRHGYVSSNEARDALAADFVASGRGSLGGMVSLDNIYDTDGFTTGNHDGYAVVIVLAAPGAATTVAVLADRGSSDAGRCEAAPPAATAGCPAATVATAPGF
ncbi:MULTISPECIES: hypothetical protein [Mycobacteriaceae]|uniref:Uncharacterized protein n=1 Tax=Mycolicibacterium parafortuitum TaxID=39692 RepID=A0ACC6MB06_MYCPF|nr:MULTISPECIES: hypothetical protein [Mycobacteriaceae]MDZ5084123.1 hypothetical protein [Mycolicibacterium parafortuitum]